jgi:hypothetical protein
VEGEEGIEPPVAIRRVRREMTAADEKELTRD